MAAVRHLGFLKFLYFYSCNCQERRTASSCQIAAKSLEPRPTYGDLSIFPSWRPSAILDLWCVCWDHPRRAFGGLYHCTKFGWTRCSSFDNMHVFRFYEFGLKTPIHTPFFGFWPPKWEAMWKNPKNAHPCAYSRRLSHHAWKSVDGSDL